MPTTKDGQKFWVQCEWAEVPHISDTEKSALLASIPEFQRDARTKGIPQLGSGAIYPVPESDIMVRDFEIPKHWPKGYGMDVGWNRTAAAWGAWDRTNDVIYITGLHYRGEAEPVVHAEAIKGRGLWMSGRIDPASRGRGQADGEQLLVMYQELGLNLAMAPNGRESGIYAVWERLSTGHLKVFKSCRAWFEEFRFYRRDEKGQIVKKKDHLMDCTRYLIAGGVSWMGNERPKQSEPQHQVYDQNMSETWMGS